MCSIQAFLHCLIEILSLFFLFSWKSNDHLEKTVEFHLIPFMIASIKEKQMSKWWPSNDSYWWLLLVCLWWLLPMTPSYWLSSLLTLVQQKCTLFQTFITVLNKNETTLQICQLHLVIVSGHYLTTSGDHLRWLPPATTSGDYLRWLPPVTTSNNCGCHLKTLRKN